jgi:hypothetical protein
MKLSFNNHTITQCLLLGVTITVLAIFWWINKNTIIEGNFTDDLKNITKNVNTNIDFNVSDNMSDNMSDNLDKISNSSIEESLYATVDTAGDSINTVLSDIASFVIEKEVDNTPKWTDITSKQITTKPDTITIAERPDTSFITTDSCSKKNILHSEYANDICEANLGDYETIDKKCKALSNENCDLVSCCVLLNGNKCVAGNINGPTFLTDQGKEIDYNYYKYRGSIYPENYNFNPTGEYLKNCGKYASNSTNISKKCIIQMFNDAGCSNKNPDLLINDSSVYKYSKSSKRYIQTDLTNAVKVLKGNIINNDEDSRILCDGRNPNKICDNYNNNSLGISKECMIEMFNEAGCPNKSPSNTIDDNFAIKNSTITKKNLKTFINTFTDKIYKLANNESDKGSDAYNENRMICYGSI